MSNVEADTRVCLLQHSTLCLPFMSERVKSFDDSGVGRTSFLVYNIPLSATVLTSTVINMTDSIIKDVSRECLHASRWAINCEEGTVSEAALWLYIPISCISTLHLSIEQAI